MQQDYSRTVKSTVPKNGSFAETSTEAVPAFLDNGKFQKLIKHVHCEEGIVQ